MNKLPTLPQLRSLARKAFCADAVEVEVERIEYHCFSARAYVKPEMHPYIGCSDTSRRCAVRALTGALNALIVE